MLFRSCVREFRRLAELLHVALVDPGGRIADRLGIARAHQIHADRRFERLVMFRKRSLGHQADCKQPRHAFRRHDERTRAGVRSQRRCDIWNIAAGPGSSVPGNAFALRIPGLARRIRTNVPTSRQQIYDAVRRAEDLGADEYVLRTTTTDLPTLDVLSDVLAAMPH